MEKIGYNNIKFQSCYIFVILKFIKIPIIINIPGYLKKNICSNVDSNMPGRVNIKMINDIGKWERRRV
jgi:hypothetical protein